MSENEHTKNEYFNVSKSPVHGDFGDDLLITAIIQSFTHGGDDAGVEKRVHRIDNLGRPCYDKAALAAEAQSYFDGLKADVALGLAAYSAPVAGDLIQARYDSRDFLWVVTKKTEYYSSPFARVGSPYLRDIEFTVEGAQFVALDLSLLEPFFARASDSNGDGTYSFVELGFTSTGSPLSLQNGRTGTCVHSRRFKNMRCPINGIIVLNFINGCLEYEFTPALDSDGLQNNFSRAKKLFEYSVLCGHWSQSHKPCLEGWNIDDDEPTIFGVGLNTSRTHLNNREVRRTIYFDSTGHLAKVSGERYVGDDPIISTDF